MSNNACGPTARHLSIVFNVRPSDNKVKMDWPDGTTTYVSLDEAKEIMAHRIAQAENIPVEKIKEALNVGGNSSGINC